MNPYSILTKLDFVCSLFFLSLFICWAYKGQNILFLDHLAFTPIIIMFCPLGWIVLEMLVGLLPTPMNHSVAYVEAI